MSYYVDDFSDYQGKKISVKWTKKLWETHLIKHPELINFENTSNLIRETILQPSLVMAGANPAIKKEFLYCYYKEVKRYQQMITFIKVVVGCIKKCHYVKSVIKKAALNYLVVKEKKYNNFDEVWRNPKSYL